PHRRPARGADVQPRADGAQPPGQPGRLPLRHVGAAAHRRPGGRPGPGVAAAPRARLGARPGQRLRRGRRRPAPRRPAPGQRAGRRPGARAGRRRPAGLPRRPGGRRRRLGAVALAERRGGAAPRGGAGPGHRRRGEAAAGVVQRVRAAVRGGLRRPRPRRHPGVPADDGGGLRRAVTPGAGSGPPSPRERGPGHGCRLLSQSVPPLPPWESGTGRSVYISAAGGFSFNQGEAVRRTGRAASQAPLHAPADLRRPMRPSATAPKWIALTTGLLSAAALAAPAPAAAEPVRPADGEQATDAPWVIAHRGASAYRPEHTMAAYKLALKQGADVIEPDLVPTSDGHLVSRHENELGGTTDVAERPEFADRKTTKVIDGQEVTGWFTEDFTLKELRTLRAVERIPDIRPGNTRYDGKYKVPTWEEIVTAWKKAVRHPEYADVKLIPELKH